MTKALNRTGKAKPTEEQGVAKGAAEPARFAASTAETAQYIAEFTAELSFLARDRRLELLAYLLDMARLEAIRAVQSHHKDR